MTEFLTNIQAIWANALPFLRDAELLLWAIGVSYFLIINYAAYLLFEVDKERAIDQERRISEATLLSCAFWGGSIGAKAAQRRFRHKTRKQPFKRNLNLICLLHLLLLIALVSWWAGLWPALVDLIL